MDTPYALVSLKETASTQDEARRRFDGSPTLVVAPRQTAGRGRGGSVWETAPRALAASLAFATGWPSATWGRIPLIAGLSTLEVLPAGLALKWPNDVVRDGAKVAGILVEGFDECIVAGIGVNLWWPDAPAEYGAVFETDPGDERHSAIARDWAKEMLRRLAAGPDSWGAAEYRRLCVTLGRMVRWQPGGSGLAEDVGDDGSLVVRTGAGTVRLTGGQVSEVRDAPSGFGGAP